MVVQPSAVSGDINVPEMMGVHVSEPEKGTGAKSDELYYISTPLSITSTTSRAQILYKDDLSKNRRPNLQPHLRVHHISASTKKAPHDVSSR